MNKRLRSELQSKLKNQPDLQISEEHLAQTMRQVRVAYQSRQSCQSRESIRYSAFLLRQIRFVGASVWLTQGLLLLCAFLLFGFTDIGDIPGTDLRHLPVLLGCFAVFVAMTSILFIGRSVRYKMLETEMVTRISIPKLLLSRIFIIGVGDLLLLTASLFLVSKKAELGAVSVALYLLLPYLIACCGYMFIGAHTHCEQQGFASTAFSFSLIALLLVLHKTAPAVYEQASAPIWIVLCAICAVILIIGIYRLLNRAASLDLSPSGI